MINVEAKISKRKLDEDLKFILTKATQQTFSIHSVNMTLQINGDPSIDLAQDLASTIIPLKVSFDKEAALFSAKGHGSVIISLSTQYNVSPNFDLVTKTAITNLRWTEKPVLDFGSMDITVEKLMDLIINHYSDLLSSSVDDAIKKSFNLNKLVEQSIDSLSKKLNETQYMGLQLYINPCDLMLERFKIVDGFLITKGVLAVEMAVGSHDPFVKRNPNFTWAQTILEDTPLYIPFDVSESVISDVLCAAIHKMEYGGKRLSTDNCKVDFEPNLVHITLGLKSPIEGKLTISGSPSFNPTVGSLALQNLKVDVQPASFLYRLTSPLISKFIQSKIEEFMPMDINALIKNKLQSYYKGKLQYNNFDIHYRIADSKIDSLKLHTNGFSAIAKLEGTTVIIADPISTADLT